MRRIAVVGTSGSGKTTLAKTLAARLNLTHIELDALHWEADWTPTPTEPLRAKVQAALADAGDRWVTDGNYSKVRPLILAQADTVIWLDYPLWVPLSRVVRRSLRRWIRREELWNGNRERGQALWGRDNLIGWVLKTHRRNRATYAALQAAPEYGYLRWVRLQSPDQADELLANVAGEWLDKKTIR